MLANLKGDRQQMTLAALGMTGVETGSFNMCLFAPAVSASFLLSTSPRSFLLSSVFFLSFTIPHNLSYVCKKSLRQLQNGLKRSAQAEDE